MKSAQSLVCISALLLLGAVDVRGEERTEFQRALQPLTDGVPQVSVLRLRTLLSKKLPNEERAAAKVKLGEALVASGDAPLALDTLSESDVRDLPGANYFRAQALAALGRWEEALPLYTASASPGARFQSEALFGKSESLRALGKNEEALQTLGELAKDRRWSSRARFRAVELLIDRNDPAGAARLLDSIEATSAADKKERRLLRGRIAAREGQPERAAELYASILKSPEGAPHSVLQADLFAIADAHLEMGTPGTGDDFLEAFIDRHPEDEGLPAIFAKLDQLYAAERKQSRHELPRWTKDPAQPRRALAQWYLAKAELRLGRREAAEQMLEQLRTQMPASSPLPQALLEYARLEQENGRWERAATILEEAQALHPPGPLLSRIDYAMGESLYESGRFEAAAKVFEGIGRTQSPSAKNALMNASFAWLEAGDRGRSEASKEALRERGADEETRGDLLLESGMAAAAKGEKEASDLLQKFIREFPKHSRIAEAWVALAELAFHASPPQIAEAETRLKSATESQPTPLADERADYLRIWLEEARTSPNEERTIELATRFLQKHDASPLSAEVRLKLAELYFRRQDFANAQTHFEVLAQRDAASPLAEKALFFAAESAMKTMGAAALDHALVLFDAVVKRNGELKWAARNEQAIIERKLGKTQDALTLYDEVLKGGAKAAEKLEASCGKGDILYDLGTVDPENYKRAIEVYDQLAREREASPHWRNQALFKKGMCLEKLNATPDALATFYQVMEDEGAPDRRREFFWFYKAGFNAARLLEEQSKWRPAAAVYEKLAFAGGARSEEAKARLSRLRLEHFLWE